MFNKSDILSQLASMQPAIDAATSVSKTKVLADLGDKAKQHELPKSKFLNALGKNKDLADPEKKITFESEWKPRKSDVPAIFRKFLTEAETSSQSNPNAFRLNLQSMVLQNTHAKFKVNRGDKEVLVEILYPNAKGQITVKLALKNAEDKLLSVDLEDPSYTGNFGAFILKEIDKLVAETRTNPLGSYKEPAGRDQGAADSDKYIPKMPSLQGYSPVWESAWEGASALVEADEEEEEVDVPAPDVKGAADNGGEMNDVEGEFGKEDFTSGDVNSDDSFRSDFGGAGSLDTLGGGMVGGGDAVNADPSGSQPGETEDTEYAQFRDKDDWTQSALDAMQKLTADATAKQMQKGSGVILSADEVLKGNVGIQNDSNYQIVDKFLKIYPELDGVDIPETMLNELEDQLSKNDGQFDSFLQQNLPKITGTDQVDDVLDNDMFSDFTPMGGEAEKKPGEKDEFSEFVGDLGGKDGGDFEEGFEEETEPEDTSDDETIKNVAAGKIGDLDMDAFPNLTK